MADKLKQQTLSLLVSGYIHEARVLLLDNRVIPCNVNSVCYDFLYIKPSYWFVQNSANIWCIFGKDDQDRLNKAVKDSKYQVKVGEREDVTVELIDKTKGEYQAEDILPVIHGQIDSYAPIIIDHGTDTIKAGFCTPETDAQPTVNVPNYVYSDATDKEQDRRYTMKHGEFQLDNWDDLVCILLFLSIGTQSVDITIINRRQFGSIYLMQN